jgi:hypothetical protein
MKIKLLQQSGACQPLWKQACCLASDGSNGYAPIVYFQRPKWIKDDAIWQQICDSIDIKLPAGFEIK